MAPAFLKFKNAGCVVSPKEDTIVEERLYKGAVYGFKYRFGNETFEAIHGTDRDCNFTGYFLTWLFHVRDSSMMMPRKLNSETCFMCLPFISKWGLMCDIFCCL